MNTLHGYYSRAAADRRVRVRFLRYYEGRLYEEAPHRAGEVAEMRFWLAEAMVDLGYAEWVR
jgi:hypothetical protein